MAGIDQKPPLENPLAEKPVDQMFLYEKVDKHIAKITLNRPEKGNAILAPVSEEDWSTRWSSPRMTKRALPTGSPNRFDVTWLNRWPA